MKKMIGLAAGVGVGVFASNYVVAATGATSSGAKLALTIATITLTAWGGVALVGALVK